MVSHQLSLEWSTSGDLQAFVRSRTGFGHATGIIWGFERSRLVLKLPNNSPALSLKMASRLLRSSDLSFDGSLPTLHRPDGSLP